MFDTAIIGTGPAGLSAAITLKMRGKSVLWFGPRSLSDKVERSEKIGNYPGLGLLSGTELNEHFRAHADLLGLEIKDRMVTLISRQSDRFMLLADNETYEAQTVLLATGVAAAKGIPGEQEFLGRGVSYCVTCDAMFYRGKTVAVLCADPRFEHEVHDLAALAEKIYFYAAYSGSKLSAENIVRLDSPITAVRGGMRVAEVEQKNGDVLPVYGLFCLRNAIAPATLMPGLAVDGAHIAVDRAMATNYPGCFAAGDCTGRPYQIAKAVGEGNIAVHSILEYLGRMD